MGSCAAVPCPESREETSVPRSITPLIARRTAASLSGVRLRLKPRYCIAAVGTSVDSTAPPTVRAPVPVGSRQRKWTLREANRLSAVSLSLTAASAMRSSGRELPCQWGFAVSAAPSAAVV